MAAAIRQRLVVTGTVQGVGFRPHVHRLATELSLCGFVGNDSCSVFIEVEGPRASLVTFGSRLAAQAPPLSRIDGIVVTEVPTTGGSDFAIVASTLGKGRPTTAPPDTAPCQDCLREMADPLDRRHRYPFITCTNCGPRFTIITALPYDRPATTMARFGLCDLCAAEYGDPTDRRFHAQPLACSDCGPRIWFEHDGHTVEGTDQTIAAAQHMLGDGGIVAVKGIGGFHLACNAEDDAAVRRLRQRKHRPSKPFAVMVADLDTASCLVPASPEGNALMSSAAAPIVLAPYTGGTGRLSKDGSGTLVMAPSLAPGNPLLGLMLPSSPLHHLLFADVPGTPSPVPRALVMTSGNLSEEPLCTTNEDALDRLADIADAWLMHDREIAVPCDDSVMKVAGVDTRADSAGQIMMIRRSRGYVPTPIRLPYVGRPSLAVGAQLKNTAALTDGSHVWLSQHIGDMGSLATLKAFERTVARFSAMHEVVPEHVAVDAHPEYTTRRWALDNMAATPVVEVQHHHAHIAAVMAEHGLDGDEPVIGVAFDGTGYGPDGTIWGGEMLLADYDSYTRLAHLSPIPLPGGDVAIRHPRRTAMSHLRCAGIDWTDDLPPVGASSTAEVRVLDQQLERNLNCVETSSMGRLFDAVSSLLGLCHDITFEAHAAIELEILAAGVAPGRGASMTLSPMARSDHVSDFRSDLGRGVHPTVWDCGGLVRQIVSLARQGVASDVIALGFHEAIANAVASVALRNRVSSAVVGLSGGVFANALLSRLVTTRLESEGFTVLSHHQFPPNDGGLALGQIAIAARQGARRYPGHWSSAASAEARLDAD